MRIRLLFVSALLLSTTSAFGQAQTFNGTVTDSMCGAHHMMKGETAAQCTRDCVKEGSDFALLSNGKVYTLKGDKTRFDSFAGENVTVKGTVSGTTITVSSIDRAK